MTSPGIVYYQKLRIICSLPLAGYGVFVFLRNKQESRKCLGDIHSLSPPALLSLNFIFSDFMLVLLFNLLDAMLNRFVPAAGNVMYLQQQPWP